MKNENFTSHLKHIISNIENDFYDEIQDDMISHQSLYPTLTIWLELHPEIVGKAFMQHLIDLEYYDLNNIEQYD